MLGLYWLLPVPYPATPLLCSIQVDVNDAFAESIRRLRAQARKGVLKDYDFISC